MLLKHFKPWKVPAVVSSMVVVGVLTHCAILNSVCDLKTAQMNMQRGIIRKLMAYEFKLSHSVMEATRNISYAKSESAIDHSTVTRWFVKFHSGCKNFDYQVRSGWPKTLDFEAVLQAIEVNLICSTQRVSISQSRVVCHFHNFGKTFDSSK